MTLGEKLKEARLEAGLSQRQLCGDIVTRNMLSQIENGAAHPSMDTLRAFAARLGRPLSYFLEEDGALSPNLAAIEQARHAYDSGDFPGALEALGQFREPDTLLGREYALLTCLSLLGAASAAAAEGRTLYALELLARAGAVSLPYCAEALERQRLLILGQVSGKKVAICDLLPSLDEELLLRAEGALEKAEYSRAAALLDVAQERSPRWQLLRGRVCLGQADYACAARCLHQAEAAFPGETVPLLETCYRELGDFRQAYFYACKRR